MNTSVIKFSTISFDVSVRIELSLACTEFFAPKIEITFEFHKMSRKLHFNSFKLLIQSKVISKSAVVSGDFEFDQF